MGDQEGGQFDIPRAIIKACCNRYEEMDPDTTKAATFCCGGGGGLLTDDLMEIRVKGALPRVQALSEVVQDSEVNTMVAICAIGKSQFTKVLPYYKMSMDMIVSLHQLVGEALVLTGQKSDDGSE